MHCILDSFAVAYQTDLSLNIRVHTYVLLQHIHQLQTIYNIYSAIAVGGSLKSSHFVIISTFHLSSFADQATARAVASRAQGMRCTGAPARQGRLAIGKMEQVGKAYVFK